jgi:transcriptional regulator with XRE-family HTH domain
MPVSDELIGRNLARMRGDMSQKELAARMKERGWKWSQATVWSVEKGERPLRLAEAEDIKAVLGTMWGLTMDDDQTTLFLANKQVSRRNAELQAAIRNFYQAQMELSLAVKSANDTRLRDAGQDWLDLTVEAVATEVRERLYLEAQIDETISSEGQADDEHPEAP